MWRKKKIFLFLSCLLLLPLIMGSVGSGAPARAAQTAQAPDESGQPQPAGAEAGGEWEDPMAPHLMSVSMYSETSLFPVAGVGNWVEAALIFDKAVYFTSGQLEFEYGPEGSEKLKGILANGHGSGTQTLRFTYWVPAPEPGEVAEVDYISDLPYGVLDKPMFKILGWDEETPVVIDDGVEWANGKRVNKENQKPIPYNPKGEFSLDPADTPLYPIFIDNVQPTIKRIWVANNPGTYGLNDRITIGIEYSEQIRPEGLPVLTLSNGATTSSVLDIDYKRDILPRTPPPNPNWDKYIFVQYTPRFGESTGEEPLDVISIDFPPASPYSHPGDQGGNRPRLDLPQGDGNNLRHFGLIIDVPPGDQPPGRAAIVNPQSTAEYSRELQAPTVHLVGSAFPADTYLLCYYWDQSNDPAKDEEKFLEDRGLFTRGKVDPNDPKFSDRGWKVAKNGARAEDPRVGSPAGDWYLHFFFAHKDGGLTLDKDGKMHWLAGPYKVDREPPVITFPLTIAEDLNTRYMVPVAVAEPHSGLRAGEISCQWLTENGQPYGDELQFAVARGQAWVSAPDQSGSYRLRVEATDAVGNASGAQFSGLYNIVEKKGEAIGNLQLEMRDPNYYFAPGQPVSSERFSHLFDLYVTVAGNVVQGQCFVAWLPPGADDLSENDGRWRLLDLATGGGAGSKVEIKVPSDLASGTYELHVMAFDLEGRAATGVLTHPTDKEAPGYFEGYAGDRVQVLVDNTPPTITITPNGSGPGKRLAAEVILEDNSPLAAEGGWANATFILVSNPGPEEAEFYMDPAGGDSSWEDHPQAENGVYPFLRWQVALPAYEELLELFGDDLEDLLYDRRLPIYQKRPAGPFYLKVMAHDEAGCETTVLSNPFYLDIEPPHVSLKVQNERGTVHPSQNLLLLADTHGEGGVEYSYIIDQGHYYKFYLGGGDGGGLQEVRHYCVPAEAPWSTWLPAEGILSIPMPQGLKDGSHLVSLRFRDKWGNEARFPAGGEPDPNPEDDEVLLDVLWSEFVEFTYSAAAGEIPADLPLAQLTYSTLNWTNKDVTATLKMSDPQGYQVKMKEGSGNSHTFTANGTHVFEYYDAKNNLRQVPAAVYWIDKEAPQVTINYSTVEPTGAGVLASIYSNELEPVTVVEADGTNDGRHFFAENGSHTFYVYDQAGNMTAAVAKVDWIDRRPPQITVGYKAPAQRGGKVEITLTGDEPFMVFNEPPELRGGAAPETKYNFTDKKTYFAGFNENYRLQCQDSAGNTALVEVSVKDVRTEEPFVTPLLEPSALTRGSVEISLMADENITLTDAQGASLSPQTIQVESNGKYTLYYKDEYGNIFSKAVQVANIDKTPPEIRFAGWDALVHGVGATIDLWEGVSAWDNRDGELTGQLTLVHDEDHPYNEQVAGIYSVSYKVTDGAGNYATRERTVRVLGAGSFALYANGQQADPEGKVNVADKTLTLQCFGTRGANSIRWMEGLHSEGVFKYITAKGRDGLGREYGVEEGNTFTLTLDHGGWYSFYVRDEDKQTKLVQVYVDYR